MVDKTIPALPDGTAVTAASVFESVEGGLSVKVTGDQLGRFIGADVLTPGASITITDNGDGTFTIAATGVGISDLIFDRPTNYGSQMVASASAFACKGIDITPTQAITLHKAGARFTTVIGATYMMVVCIISAGGLISAVVSSTPIVAAAVALGNYIFTFPMPVVLAAGTRYAVALVRTDGANNYALPIWSTTSATCFMGTAPCVYNGLVRLAQNNPIAGQTFTLAAGQADNVILGFPSP